ncbi:leucine-rich repeat protein, partial [Bacteroides heparinolyticus]
IYSILKGNQLIETFNEFRYFTGLKKIGGGMFEGCSNLRELTFPVCQTTKLERYLVNNTKVVRFIVPEGYTEIETIRTGEGEPFRLIDLPSTMRNIIGFMWNYGCDTLVCRAVTPPSVNWLRTTMLNKIYVPDTAVEDYRMASGWNSKASIIYPLSEYNNNL